jgi:probable rRNA maturation factor
MLRSEGIADTGEVHCVLSSDEEVASLNRKFRGKEGPTDVLAFPYDPESAGGVHGDVYVSLDRAREQARFHGDTVEREVWRLFVHGALHLAGWDHDTDKAESAMRARQEEWVDRVFPAGAPPPVDTR